MSKTFFAGSSQASPPPNGCEQLGHRHRRAFDVPARTAGRRDAAGARPSRLVRLRRLPQHEVHRIALVGRDVDARAGEHLVERAPRQRRRSAARREARPSRWARTARGPRRHRRRRAPPAARSAPSSRRYARSRAARGSASGSRARRRRRGTAARSPRSRGRSPVERQVGEVARGARVDLVVDVGDVARVDDVRPRRRAAAAGETARRRR